MGTLGKEKCSCIDTRIFPNPMGQVNPYGLHTAKKDRRFAYPFLLVTRTGLEAYYWNAVSLYFQGFHRILSKYCPKKINTLKRLKSQANVMMLDLFLLLQIHIPIWNNKTLKLFDRWHKEVFCFSCLQNNKTLKRSVRNIFPVHGFSCLQNNKTLKLVVQVRGTGPQF